MNDLSFPKCWFSLLSVCVVGAACQGTSASVVSRQAKSAALEGAVYEAEERASEHSCSMMAVHAGFTGTGFMDFGGIGSWIEWNDVLASVAGKYSLTFRYANGGAGRRSALIVNGETVGKVAFRNTGGWSSWGSDTIEVSLASGRNTIRVMADSGAGGPNLDNLKLTLVAGADDDCPHDANKTEPGQCGCGVADTDFDGDGVADCVYEAEERTSDHSCSMTAVHAGFTGTGFMDFGGIGSWIEWNDVWASVAGEYSLTFRYANGGAGRRSALIVNGETVGKVAFRNTGGWLRWGAEPIEVSLASGRNTIRVMADSGAGGPNLDNLKLTLVAGADDDCPHDANKTEPGQCGCGVADTDSDGDGVADCVDGCAADASKVAPGDCGCGVADTDFDGDGVADCVDGCPADASKVAPGDCGCGVADQDCIPDGDGRLRVFILAGQSNMVGAGTVSPTQRQLDKNGGMGTLEYLIAAPETAPVVGHLATQDGGWRARDDVWLVDGNYSGPLTITKNTFGPELQFGHAMGDHYADPVLLIKVAWGGKSLHVDFRPPSSGGQVGAYYSKLVERVDEVLADVGAFWPDHAAVGYEIAGFAWHQGWNDRVNQSYNDAYQTNCVNLINDLRADLGVPGMPFVLATTGMAGWGETHHRALSLMQAQLAVPDDARLLEGNVAAVETRDYWRDGAVSPSNQSYHWNGNAETYFWIGNGLAEALLELLPSSDAGRIDGVYFAQNHVHAPDDPLFRLVSDRAALIKVHVVSPTPVAAPPVSARLRLGTRERVLSLQGPSHLPESIPSGPGVIQHRYEDSFTALIARDWVQPGLSVSVHAGGKRLDLGELNVGAPTRLIMNMFDVHLFTETQGDYPAGWQGELEAKLPISELELRRLPRVVFEELVIPPRAGVQAARVSSKDDYKEQTGIRFDGEQAASLQWVRALQAAAGTDGRTSLYYVNIYGVPAGGQAGGFRGVGSGTSAGVFLHELGHALSLPHWGQSSRYYPYMGDMFGIAAPMSHNATHAGPTWAFDLPSETFIPPTVQASSVGGILGTYKRDPMQGGGQGDQEQGFLFRHFSDYSVSVIRNYLESRVVVWNEELSSYARWDSESGSYSSPVSNNGLRLPVQRDVEVVSVMAGVSAVTPSATMVYPPIGPYVAGLVDLYDPRDVEDRNRAQDIYCPSLGCDLTLRIVQGGEEVFYMLPITYSGLSQADPLSARSYETRAVNLPASDGTITHVELLLTPNAADNGLPEQTTVLDSWSQSP